MAKQSIIVIDDFFEDIDQVRRLALSLEYRSKSGATYPGREAVAAFDWSEVRRKLRGYVDEPIDAPCPKKPEFPQGKFRLALAADENLRLDRVHVDRQSWSAVIYLTLPEHCSEGLVLYRHRATNSVFWDEAWFQEHHEHLYSLPDKEFKQRVLEYFKDPSTFEQIGLVPMAYNRAVLLMAHVLHGSGVAFGATKEEGRLTQHFEFYSATD